MPKRDPRMIPIGYGKFIRADRVYALVPIEGQQRGEGRRTYVHVDGLAEPIVASRSERAILADVEEALAEAAGIPRRRRAPAGQGEPALIGLGRRRRAPGPRLGRPRPPRCDARLRELAEPGDEVIVVERPAEADRPGPERRRPG